MDPLQDALRAVRLKGAVYLDARFTAPWCVVSQLVSDDCKPLLQHPQNMVSYHYMAEGRMLISVDNSAPLEIRSGEIVMLPRNDRHVIGSTLTGNPPLGRDLVQPSPDGGLARVNFGGGGEPSRLICGFLGADEAFNPLIASLPPIIKVDVRQAASRGLIEASMEYAATEISAGRVSSPAALAQLSELLLVEAVRQYASTLGEGLSGWLRGVSDPQIGKAITLIHQDTKSDWTAESLADAVAMSRSAFMSRFKSLVGQPPMRYLTTWRMSLAQRELIETSRSIAQVAFAIGYESEDAFSRAFKREFGVSPSKWREQRKA